jgi:coenzyme F420 hydrogenase subunit beta
MKKENRNNIWFVARNQLCTGCGICADVCPTGSIQIRLKEGLYQPHLNSTTCLSDKGCSKCLKVCPGFSIDLTKRSEDLFKTNSHSDSYAGYFEACYSGYSLNQMIRYHSASGGLLSQFLIFLLNKKFIDGAVVTGFNQNDKTTPYVFLAKTAEEILYVRSLKYCPVNMSNIGNEIKEQEGKFIIVGLPCHIQGFRKRADIDPAFKRKIVGYFSIYCSSNRSFLATEYLFRKHQINTEEIKYFAYRDEGCLGFMKIVQNKGDTTLVPYLNYYPGIRSFFKPRRCLSCIDHYGLLADVCFGDIHIAPYDQDKIGVNSIIVRNPIFNNWVQQAVQEGIISLTNIPAQTVNQSQKAMLYPKKKKVYALQYFDRLLGREIVSYDEDLKTIIGIKDIATMLFTELQRFIGKHRRLWFLIRLSNLFKR